MKRKLKYKRLIWSHILLLILGVTIGFGITNYDFDSDTNQFKEEVLGRLSLSDHVKGESYVAAVDNNNKGLLGKVNVDISEGEGLILINTNPFLEPDTQFSANVAVDIASKVTGISLEDKNIIVDFELEGTVIGGPSAGAAMTLATISAIEGEKVNNIVITGTILPNGVIGQVGGIVEKGQAASAAGADIFLVPEGQGTFTYYEKGLQEKPNKGSIKIYNEVLIRKRVDLIAYFKEELDLDVIEVKDIRDAMTYAF